VFTDRKLLVEMSVWWTEFRDGRKALDDDVEKHKGRART
jgi:hypothetical protein